MKLEHQRWLWRSRKSKIAKKQHKFKKRKQEVINKIKAKKLTLDGIHILSNKLKKSFHSKNRSHQRDICLDVSKVIKWIMWWNIFYKNNDTWVFHILHNWIVYVLSLNLIILTTYRSLEATNMNKVSLQTFLYRTKLYDQSPGIELIR